MAIPTPQFSGESFTPDELQRITAETFVERVKYHTELDSTNSRALDLAREDASSGVTLVLAERQTAGRGRGVNRWWAGPGALTFSVVLPGGSLALSTGDWPKLSLLTGLAVAQSLDVFVSGESALLKWPNDVYLRQRKVCGILVEGSSGESSVLVVGVGVNVNNSLADMPEDLSAKAIAVREVLGKAVSRAELLIAILQRLASRFEELHSGDARWQEHWRSRCLLTGRTVQLDIHGGPVTGVCRGIDENGALLLDTETGLRSYLSGVVAQFG